MTNILRLIDFLYNVKKVLTFHIFVSNIGNTKGFHDVYFQYLHESKKLSIFVTLLENIYGIEFMMYLLLPCGI